MTVPVQTPFNSSTGNGVTTVFPYTFLILDEEDIKVTVDGVLKTIATDYTVSGVGNPSGGSVTFMAAPANGTTVVRYSDTILKRETDYQTNGDFREVVVDTDFDRAWLAIRDTSALAQRAMRVPAGETAVTLPAAADRASAFLAFDVAGAPIAASGAAAAPVSTFVAPALVSTPPFFSLQGGGYWSSDTGAGGNPVLIARAHPTLDIGEIGTTTAHTLNIITSSVSRATVDAVGNVQIGTTAIAGARTVQVVNTDAGAGSNVQIYGQSNAGNVTLQINSTLGGGGASVTTNATGGLTVGTTGATAVNINTNGLARLSVSAAGAVNATVSLSENSTRVFSRNSANLGSPPAGQNYDAANKVFTFAHGLGQVPVLYSVWLDCIDGTANTAGSAYPLGHRIFVNNNNSSSACNVTADATNIYVRVAGNIAVSDFATPSSIVALTAGAKWQINARAWY